MSGPRIKEQKILVYPVTEVWCWNLKDLGDGRIEGYVRTPSGFVSVWQQRMRDDWWASISVIKDGIDTTVNRTLSGPYTVLGLTRLAGQLHRGEIS